MQEWAVIVWMLIVGVITLNGFAAGVAAALHAWRSKSSRGGRTILASAAAGLLPASFVVIVAIFESSLGAGEDTEVYIAVFAVFFAIATLVSVPGAIIIANKLEKPGDDFRAFE